MRWNGVTPPGSALNPSASALGVGLGRAHRFGEGRSGGVRLAKLHPHQPDARMQHRPEVPAIRELRRERLGLVE
jgi:hypothetical protein